MNHPEIDFRTAYNIFYRHSEAGLAVYKYMYGSNDDLKARNETNWFPFKSSSMNKGNVLDTIEARKTPGEFNVIRDFPDGKREFSRFSNGQLKWEVEQTPNSLGGYTNSFIGKNEGCLHSHLEGHTIKLSLNHKNGNNRITLIDNEANKIISQETLSKDMALKRYVDMHDKIAIKGLQREIKEMKESRTNGMNTNTDRTSAFEKEQIKAPDRSGATNNNASAIQKARENIKTDTKGIINPPNKTGFKDNITSVQSGQIKAPDMSAAMNTNMNAGMGGAMNAGMGINPMQMQQFGGR